MSIDFATFIDRICESGLITLPELEAFRDRLPETVTRDDVEAFGRELIRAKKLTSYQVGRILHGRQAGLMIGKNVLLGRIGEGGMGRVYKAEHQTMKRTVALKVINETALRSEQSRRRFLQEVQTAAKLLHPNVVTAYDAGEQDDVPYLVMEYVEGDNLRNIIKENGPLSFDKAIDYILQAAHGLKYAHSRGVIHRDIKPSNLLLDDQGVVKILDMGLAYVEADPNAAANTELSDLTNEKNIVGTVEYMAPEQADGTQDVDQRSDIYSLGCSLYYLLTGQPPFHRDTQVKTLVAHRVDPIPSLRTFLPEISNKADRLFAKMVAKHPDDRYQSVQEVIDAIKQLIGDNDFELLEERPSGDAHDTEYFETGELLVESASGELERLKSAQNNGMPRYDKLTEHAVGIDLGTTFSAISYLDNSGRPTTLANAEGDKLTPSVVLFDEGDVIVGKEAVKAMATDMPMIAECAKRDVGSVSFHKRFKGKRFRPEVLLAFILRKLKDDAEEQIGPIRRAVITVPAYFDEIRRKATQDAGYLAGLEVMDIINEPTSAAVAFGYHLATIQSDEERQISDRPQRILVYDLGGGTFDVTVMEIRSNVYRTMATDGDVRLGGRDWDERLVDYVAQKFLDRTGDDPRLDANSMGRLLRECEDAKRTLSARDKATIAIEYEGRAMRVPMARKLFEELTHDLLARTEFTTRQTLKAAGLTWKKINRVLLVGGSTRMPAVAKMLYEMSGIKPDRSVAADEAVAHGAAIRAGMLLLRQQGEPMPIKITNVNSHSLGVIGTNPTNGEKQAGVLIPRNTALPASAQRIFRTLKDNQTSILVQIVEGESSIPKECSMVGKCIVHNLPKKLPARTPITISFQYDENGRLTVSVKVTGIELKQQIMRENSMTNKEMERWRQVIAGEIGLEALT